MKKVSSINPLKPIVSFFDRFNLVSFIVIVVGGLIAAIMILTNILIRPYDSTAVTNTVTVQSGANFDQTTINKLLKLDDSSKNSNYNSLLPGRNNPFSE